MREAIPMLTPQRTLPLLLGLALALGLAGPSQAGFLAFDFAPAKQYTFPSLDPTTDGFLFIPTVDIRVTHLGYYDEFQDGLLLQHLVGIFDKTSGLLLDSTVVGPSTAFGGLFAYEALTTPLVLTAGQSYVVAGFHPGGADDAVATSVVGDPSFDAGVAPDPSIGYQGYVFDQSGSFALPGGTPDTGFFAFGPNFQFEEVNAAAVPEPSSVVLLGIGVTGLAFSAWRRRGKKPE
jgi:hypothetical protein